jgi:hypothetical protein
MAGGASMPPRFAPSAIWRLHSRRFPSSAFNAQENGSFRECNSLAAAPASGEYENGVRKDHPTCILARGLGLFPIGCRLVAQGVIATLSTPSR